MVIRIPKEAEIFFLLAPFLVVATSLHVCACVRACSHVSVHLHRCACAVRLEDQGMGLSTDCLGSGVREGTREAPSLSLYSLL